MVKRKGYSGGGWILWGYFPTQFLFSIKRLFYTGFFWMDKGEDGDFGAKACCWREIGNEQVSQELS